MFAHRLASLAILTATVTLSAQQPAANGSSPGAQVRPATAKNQANRFQLSGTIVDASGAVIAGADVHVLSQDGTVQRTVHSGADGSFVFSGLAAGNYRVAVMNPGFETKEIPITIGTAEAPAPLRISLAVGTVNTTVSVQGRADDLIGIATSAGDVTVGAEELQNRPILRSGEVLETLPGLDHHPARRRRQGQPVFSCAASISTTAPTSRSSSTGCR